MGSLFSEARVSKIDTCSPGDLQADSPVLVQAGFGVQVSGACGDVLSLTLVRET